MGKNKKKMDKFYIKDFITNTDNCDEVDIGDFSTKYMTLHGINRNIARNLSASYDGLKPVSRRALYALYNLKNNGRSYQKLNKVAGDTIGNFHPHGDTSVMDVLARMGQDWTNNICMIDGRGNFGNRQGKEPAAGRYLEVKLSDFAYKCYFEDYKYSKVDTKLNYLGTELVPEYLPAKYPIGLVNPQFSNIGYGTSADIAPYNFKEVCEATIKLLDDPDAKINLVPDFPTGCDVIVDKHITEILNTGIGKVNTQATCSIDHKTNIIHITSLPLLVGVSDLLKNISMAVLEKKISGIKDVRDYTNPDDGYNISIVLHKDVNPNKVLADLIDLNIGLRKSYGVRLNFIVDYKEKLYTPKEYLLDWIDFRREIVESIFNNKYIQLSEEQHMNDVKIFVFNKDNLDDTIEICRKANNEQDAIDKLLAKYGDSKIHMTSLQAKAIQKLRFSDYNKEARDGFKRRKKELIEEISEIEAMLSSPSGFDDYIRKELREGIELFGEPRRSKLVREKGIDVKDTKHVVAISNDGYIKKIDIVKGVDPILGRLGNLVSQPTIAIRTSNTKSIMVLDSKGTITRVPVAGIPSFTPDENGIEISRFFKVSGEVVAILDKGATNDNVCYTFFTKNGFAKRTLSTAFDKCPDGKTAISLTDGDELVTALPTKKDSKGNVILYTNKGNGLRIPVQDIRLLSASARGTNLINLPDGEYVSGVDTISRGFDNLVYITANGKVKKTDLNLLPVSKRKGELLSLISLDKDDYLVALLATHNTDSIKVFKKVTEPYVLKVSDIPVSMRIAKAEKMVKLGRGDIVLSVQRIEE